MLSQFVEVQPVCSLGVFAELECTVPSRPVNDQRPVRKASFFRKSTYLGDLSRHLGWVRYAVSSCGWVAEFAELGIGG
jgi:hypothetical protein